MSELNPYSPPQADLSEPAPTEKSNHVLAGRGERLGSSFIDGLILLIPMALLIWFAYALFDLRLWEPSPGIKGYLTGIAMAILSSLIFLAINGRALARDGQTIGKRLNGIQIVKMDGSIPSLWDSFLIRYFCLMLIYQVPIFGGVVSLVGPLMIFRSSRRCLHDELAGTVVVKVA